MDTVKKVSDIPVPSRDVTNHILFSVRETGEFRLVTSRLGTQKSITFFTVYYNVM